MRGPAYKQKKVTVSISAVAHKQIEKLAKQKDIMVSDYVRKLIIQHLLELGLPVYYDIDEIERSWTEEKSAGQE